MIKPQLFLFPMGVISRGVAAWAAYATLDQVSRDWRCSIKKKHAAYSDFVFFSKKDRHLQIEIHIVSVTVSSKSAHAGKRQLQVDPGVEPGLEVPLLIHWIS